MKVQDQHQIKPETQSCKTSVISSFFKKLFRIHYYRFQKPIWGTLKCSTKYHLSITFFNKWSLNFRIMSQDNSFFFRNEELYMWIQGIKQRDIKF
jgi:hypothetical protein